MSRRRRSEKDEAEEEEYVDVESMSSEEEAEEETGIMISSSSRKKRRVEEDEEEDKDEAEEEDDATMNEEENAGWGNAGQVQKIRLENFMCHKKLELEFCNGINFITGPNGSGKSAILTALILGLGASKGATGRGAKSLESFIGPFGDEASISIWLSNKGRLPFKKEQYGHTIHVERRFIKSTAANGKVTCTTNYKLKGVKSRSAIASTKKEVEDMLAQLNIQIDNPCAILMQDVSRKYLIQSKPKEKFTFWKMATFLKQMEDNLDATQDVKESAESTLSAKKKGIPAMEKKKEEAKRAWNHAQQLQDLEDRIVQAEIELLWAMVHKQEQKRDAYLSNLETNKTKKATYQDSVAKLERKHNELKAELEEMVAMLNQKSNETSAIIARRDQCQSQLKSARQQLRGVETEMKNAAEEKSNIEKRIVRIRRAIEEEVRRADPGDLNRLIEEENATRNQLNSDKLNLKQLESRYEATDERVSAMQRQKDDIDSNIRQLTNQIKSAENRIRNLQAAKQNENARFGAELGALKQQIERERWTQRKPVGPLGMYLKVPPEWCTAVEVATRDQLTAFVVAPADVAKLQQLARRNNVRGLKILKSKPPSREYTVQPVRYKSILQEVEFVGERDEVIWAKNTLIDKARIDCVGLESGPGHRIVAMVEQYHQMFLSPNGDKYTYYAANRGGATSKTANRSGKAKFLVPRDDIDGVLREKQTEMQRYQEDLASAKQKHSRIGAELKGIERQRNEMGREISRVRSSIGRMEAALSDIADRKRELSMEIEEPDNSEREKEIQEKQQQIRAKDAEIEQLLKKKENIKEEIGRQTANIEKILSQIEGIDDKYKDHNDKAETLSGQVKAVFGQLITYKSRLKKVEGACIEAETCFAEAEELVRDMTESALKKGERVENCQEPSKLKGLIKGMQESLAQQTGEKSIDDLLREFSKVTTACKTTQKQIRSCEHEFELLEQSLVRLRKRWNNFYKSFKQQTSDRFNHLLGNRGISGRLVFNDEEETLSLEISIHHDKDGKLQTQKTESLSGGERSYSTVAFLMALWEHMQCPFTAMDEFDVYMDQVNRKVSIQTLMDAAKIHKERQFLFITPQSLDHVRPDKNIKVFRMAAPERRESRP